LIQGDNEDFPVADTSILLGLGTAQDGLHCRFDEFFVDSDLKLQFPQQVDRSVRGALEALVPLLPGVSQAIDDGESKDLDLAQSFLDRLEPIGLNDGDD
jgi:hypothetical protein